MLNNHMQSIVAYFSKPTDIEQPNPALSEAQRPYSHLRPVINQLIKNSAVQPRAGEQFSPTHRFEARSSLASTPFHRLRQFWQSLIWVNADPRVQEGVNSSGDVYWRVYDPVAQASHTFFAEEDVYRWLERRYYE